MPKRQGFFMEELCDRDNIVKGYKNSKHGKTYVYNMLKHKEFNPDEVIDKLQYDFINGLYKTSDYTVFKVYEPKERVIFRLPYAPDRIAHHAIMNVLEGYWTNKISNTSYSCIKNRGIYGAYKYLKKCLRDIKNTKYCLKCDIKKFFPSVNHRIMKQVVTRYIKDSEILDIIYEIIDSTDRCSFCIKGCNLPIGNYLSQYLANLIVSLVIMTLRKEFPRVKIIVYMDDIIILAPNKGILHECNDRLIKILNEFCLTMKSNYQIFPVDSRGISFVGFRFYHNKILLRKNIYYKIIKLCYKYKNNKITKSQFKKSMAAYYGWLKCCKSKGICRVVYSITGIYYSNWKGPRVKISTLYDKSLRLYHIDKRNKYSLLQVVYNRRPIEIYTTNRKLIRNLLKIKRNYYSPNIKINFYL